MTRDPLVPHPKENPPMNTYLAALIAVPASTPVNVGGIQNLLLRPRRGCSTSER